MHITSKKFVVSFILFYSCIIAVNTCAQNFWKKNPVVSVVVKSPTKEHVFYARLFEYNHNKKIVIVSVWNDLEKKEGQEFLNNVDNGPIVAVRAAKFSDYPGMPGLTELGFCSNSNCEIFRMLI